MSDATPDNSGSSPAASTTPDTSTTPAATTPASVTTPAAGDSTPAAGSSTPAAGSSTPAAGGDTTAPAVKDWATRRAEYAKGDEKILKRLERYSSEESLVEALIHAQNKISSGTMKNALPENPTAEQLAEWRAENGIPSKPEEYDIKLPNGAEISELDKPFVDALTKSAHEANMTPAQVNKALEWYMNTQEQQATQLRQADEAYRAEAQETLREAWGSEYKLNLNLIDGLLNGAPQGAKEHLLTARLGDGTPLGDNPAVLRWLADLARQINPVATVVPGSSGNAAQAIESELEGIVKLMGDTNSAYWKGPTAEKMQARYRELVTVQEKIKR